MAKILVIDDDELIADIVGHCLRDAGHEVVICLDSSEAAAAVAAERPDLAIIDYQMPGKTGVQLLADLRARPETRLLPVLFLSAMDAIRFAGQVPPESRARFLSKPVQKSELLQLIEEMLDPEGWSA
jgi:CheY-like chemotaxis protein